MNKTSMKDIPDPVKKPRFLWKKEWVRSHESLWSVMRNFRIVNGNCNYQGALKLLDIQIHGNPKQNLGVEERFGVFSRYTIKDEWAGIMEEKLLPLWYIEKLEPFSKLILQAPALVSEKLYYCPKCLEHGYHSYIHQLAGIWTCPFHKGVSLKVDHSETYVWGESRRFEYDHSDEYFYRKVFFNVFQRNICDFGDKIFGRLPTEWHMPCELLNTINSTSVFSKYDQLTVVVSDIGFRNTNIKGGTMFLEDKKRMPFVTIYDAMGSDNLMLEKLKEKLREMRLKNLYIDEKFDFIKLRYLQYDRELLLLVLAKEFMSGISIDDVRTAEGNLITGGKVDIKDDIGVKTLFLWEYTHSKLLHEFLTIDDYEGFSDYRGRYKPKRFCVDSILRSDIMFNYGMTAMIHILRDHMETCYQDFICFLIHDRECRENGLHYNDEYDLFETPTYIIIKNGEILRLYRAR